MREPHSVDVEWSEAERGFYLEYLAWCKARSALAKTPLNFSMQMPLRLASSCLPAAASRVLSWHSQAEDSEDGDDPDPSLSPSQTLAPHPDLLSAAKKLGTVDSKLDQLLAVVDRMSANGQQILLFTYSRETLRYLTRRLAGRVRLAALHGGIDKHSRQQVMADFRAGKYDVVLATRVASEGLDFEFCSILVNYDLPWNPMEVEQRIGRLDRIGQQSEKILVFNFHTPDTIESAILSRILDRIGVFERSIGELEPIIQDAWGELRQVAFDFSLSEEQRALKADQVLAAIETQGIDLEELRAATEYLLSSDEAPIDGMEEDLVRSGRYVGQNELANLLDDWAEIAGGRPTKVDEVGRTLHFRGVPAMARQFDAVVRDGERSPAEVREIQTALRNDADIYLALDPEVSRTTGLDLLTSAHPLTRAAMRVPGHEQARFSRVRLTTSDSQMSTGVFLVQIAVATWDGLRPAREVWTSAVNLETQEVTEGAGDALLAAIASGTITDSRLDPGVDSASVALSTDILLHRQSDEETRRTAENEALMQTRLASIQSMHGRKVEDLESRRDLVLSKSDLRTARLFEGQLARAHERLQRVEAELDERSSCGLRLEPLAICVVEVGP